MQTTGPKGLAVLKSIIDFYRDPLTMLTKLDAEHTDISMIKLGPIMMYQVVQPAHVQRVLQDHADKYKMSGVFEQTGHGLTTLGGDMWRQHRRIMQPAFQHQHLHYTMSPINEITAKTFARWEVLNLEKRINIADELLFLHHRILGNILFGVDFETPEDPRLQALRQVREYMARRIHAMVTVPENLPTPRNRNYAKAQAYLLNFISEQIQYQQTTSDAPRCMLTALLHARDDRSGASLSEQELSDELMDLFFAAYEDPANVLTWALYELTQHPNNATQLVTEVDTILEGQPPTIESLGELTYTNQVLDEILRLYPPTWSLMRDVVEDDAVDGYTIQKDAMLMINIYLTHRLEKYWDSPNEFRPERFTENDERERFMFYPFGGGPRKCIGSSLAMIELTAVLALLMQRYTWTLLPESEIKVIVHNSLQPAHTIWMQMRRR